MKLKTLKQMVIRFLVIGSIPLGMQLVAMGPESSAQGVDSHIPDLAGIWDGTPRSRPVNGEHVPWGEGNFPDLNARAKAYQEVWEEIMAPKYDCQPASSPAIQYDPYHMQVTQWPDRVLLRYEKDDQLRTIWLDGREPVSYTHLTLPTT